MSTRVFLGNLPYNITKDELEAFVAELGLKPSEVTVVTDRETGSGRGFGFLEFGSSAAAAAAISTLNGASIHGRLIRADKATERPSGGGGGGGRSSGGGGGGGGGFRSGRDDRGGHDDDRGDRGRRGRRERT